MLNATSSSSSDWLESELAYGAVNLNASSGYAVKSITERQNVLKQTY